jgi:hypothetical protein
VASIEPSKSCTIASVPIPAPVAGGDDVLAAPYPHALVAVWSLTEGYPNRPEIWTESEFDPLSKSKRQRWIRKLKKYVTCLRVAHHVDENSDPEKAPEADSAEEDQTPQGTQEAPEEDPEAIMNTPPTAEASDVEEEEMDT